MRPRAAAEARGARWHRHVARKAISLLSSLIRLPDPSSIRQRQPAWRCDPVRRYETDYRNRGGRGDKNKYSNVKLGALLTREMIAACRASRASEMRNNHREGCNARGAGLPEAARRGRHFTARRPAPRSVEKQANKT